MTDGSLNGFRSLWLALCIVFLFCSGCVRQRITQNFGLTGPVKSQHSTSKGQAPDNSFRAIFQKQKVGSFDPLTDDTRVQALQARLKTNPQDMSGHLELGTIYESYNLFDMAFEQYTQALQLATSGGTDPVRAEQAALGFGRMAQSLGQTREAIPQIEKFAKERTSANAWNQVGLLYDAALDLVSGEKSFRQAIDLNPGTDRFYNNLGYNLLLQKKTEMAAEEFRKARDLNPASVVTRNNLGVALARLGDLDGALQEFEAAADPATAHNNLAVVLLEAGQYEQSRDELVKALAIRHSFAPALENFKLVQERLRGGGGAQAR